MHSVYMTHNPCVYNPSLHVYTQSVQNPASMGGDPVRDGELQQKGQVYTALWNKPDLASISTVDHVKEGRIVRS